MSDDLSNHLTKSAEQSDALARLKTAMQVARLACWEHHHQTSRLVWSLEVHEIFNTPINDGSYECFIGQFHPEDREALNEAYQAALQTGEHLNFRARLEGDEDQGERTVRIRFCSQTDEQGNLVSTYGTLQDITDLVLREQENDDFNKELIHTSKLASIGELSVEIGHEINNPLMVLESGLNLFERDLERTNHLSKERHRVLSQLVDAVDRIRDVLEGLKSYSHPDDGKVTVLDVRDSIQTTLNFVERIFENSGVRFEVESVDEALLVQIRRGFVQQVLVNLFNNAKDAIEDSGQEQGWIKIRADILGGDQIRVRVKDNGGGIPQEKIESIFQSFYTTKGHGKGTGLGLSIVKELVTKMNGSISVASTEGEGTEFTILLPQAIRASEPAQVQERVNRVELTGRVLLVEDEEAISEFIQTYLENCGMVVDLADGGVRGLELANQNTYDYVITDYTMPHMNGEEFIDNLRELESFKGKIVVLSGMMDDQPTNLNADAFLSKPCTLDQIYDTLALLSQGEISGVAI